MKFFFDNNLSPVLARAVGILAERDGHAVTHLRDMFPSETTDIEWISKLGRSGHWVVLSGDHRISRNRHEREAWRRAHLTTFFLSKGWQNQRFWDQAWRLVRWWPRIVEQAGLVQPGAVFQIPVQYGSAKFKQFS